MDSISGPAALRHTSSSLIRGDYIIPDSVTCPICGDYTDRAESVIAHIVGSTGSHKGTGYTSARSMVERQVSGDDPEINEAEDDPEEPAARAEDQAEVDPETSATETSATSRASTDGGPRPPPEPDVDVEDQDSGNDDPAETVEDVDGSDTVDCPNCGEDTGLSAHDHERGEQYHCLECNDRYLWHEQ